MARSKREGRQKLTNKSLEMLQKRRQLLNEGKRHSAEYTELNRNIRKQIKEELQKHREEQTEKIIENNKNLKCLRQGKGRKKLPA